MQSSTLATSAGESTLLGQSTEQLTSDCPVHSYNEWDPLEEVIVGRLEDAAIPSYHPAVTFNLPARVVRLYRLFAGRRYPGPLVRAAQDDLDQFIAILETAGVKVRRPDPFPHRAKYKTPEWSSRGFCSACPRDGFLVLGDEIVETPMAWRCRYFEPYAYRSIFREYFQQGARWTAAPRPQLLDALYDPHFSLPLPGEPLRYVVRDFEPVFDAADFVRCGRDIFGQRSNVTNESGIQWLKRHVGSRFRIHEIRTRCRQPMHIDSTFMPLAPGKVLVNPDYLDPGDLPPMFKSWEVLVAPQPDPLPGFRSRFSMCSKWLSINVLMLDPKRVVVEKSQPSMIRALEKWGFEPIPCSFVNYGAFGGSFHCATLDIRRRGTLESYF